MGQGRPRFGCPILRRPKIRAVSRVLVVVHGRVLLLAAHDGAHVGETALVVSAKARLVVHHSALGLGDGRAPLDFPLPVFVGREGLRAGLGSRLGPLCLGVAGRGGAGTNSVKRRQGDVPWDAMRRTFQL